MLHESPRPQRILITGGAGFIGSRLALRLAAEGNDITIVDTLSPQVHGVAAEFPQALTTAVRCVRGDVCDRALMGELVAGQNVIVHLAAETGTGQSMYAVEHYAQVNVMGTAILLDLLMNNRSADLRKLVVASSRAIYGEGRYICAACDDVYPAPRTAEQVAAGQFEPLCPHCGGAVTVAATPESVPFGPASFYGLTKQVQEQMVLMFASALGIDGFALRYQNVYGPGQSLQNPYTGILAVFTNLVRQDRQLNVFEDGRESRDFVYVDDVVEATASCASSNVHGVRALNVGSGTRTSVLEVAHAVRAYFGRQVPIEVTGDFRVGDIRHNVADIARIQALTGYVPKWSFADGLEQFLRWAEREDAQEGGLNHALEEMRARGLLVTGRRG